MVPAKGGQGSLAQSVDAPHRHFFVAFQLKGNRTGQGAVVTQHQIFRFCQKAPGSSSRLKTEVRLRPFCGLLDHLHLVQLALTAAGHAGGSYSCLVPGNEIFQFRHFLLLPHIGGFQLGLVDLVQFLEFVIVPGVTGQLTAFQMINYVGNII